MHQEASLRRPCTALPATRYNSLRRPCTALPATRYNSLRRPCTALPATRYNSLRRPCTTSAQGIEACCGALARQSLQQEAAGPLQHEPAGPLQHEQAAAALAHQSLHQGVGEIDRVRALLRH
jgi:hypothetical protein